MLAGSAIPALADFSGTVIAIHDGDSLTVLVERIQVKVRVADIDAPEAKQAFGTRSRQALGALCHEKRPTVVDRGLDRYGRTIGVVSCGGRDAATEQVRAGMAWVFVRFAAKDSPLYQLEAEARAARRRLWVDPNPIPPWEWRAQSALPRRAAQSGEGVESPVPDLSYDRELVGISRALPSTKSRLLASSGRVPAGMSTAVSVVTRPEMWSVGYEFQ